MATFHLEAKNIRGGQVKIIGLGSGDDCKQNVSFGLFYRTQSWLPAE